MGYVRESCFPDKAGQQSEDVVRCGLEAIQELDGEEENSEELFRGMPQSAMCN